MKQKTNIYIDFIGSDYSPINEAIWNAKVYLNDKVEDKLLEKDSEELVKKQFEERLKVPEKYNFISNSISFSNKDMRNILEKFLGKVNSEDLLINKSKESGSNGKKIWDPNFNGGYFCGIVGVLNGEIHMNSYELDMDFKQNELEQLANSSEEYVFKIHLQIQSRLDKKDESNLGKAYFLSTLLLSDKIKMNNNNVPSSEDELYDYLLLFWFKEQLQSAYLKGFYRTYRRFEKNDDRLKGSIDITTHIRVNMGQNNGKIAYSYRENTINNYLNHMIVKAYEHLKQKYYDLVADNFDNNMELKSIISSLKTEIGYSSYSSQELIAKNIKSISHPYYTEYEDLRQSCAKILRDEGISIFDAEEDNINGILVYLPDLWENYLEKHMNNAIKGSSIGDIKMISQNKIDVFEKRVRDTNFKYVQETRPDYVFEKEKESKKFMILDAKFKPKWETVFDNTETSLSEVLEDFDKCLRDMVDIGGFATGVIFPTNKEIDNTESIVSHKISQWNNACRFYTLPIHIPYSNSEEAYSDWSDKLEISVGKSMNIFNKVLVYEKGYFETVSAKYKEIQNLREREKKSPFEQ